MKWDDHQKRCCASATTAGRCAHPEEERSGEVFPSLAEQPRIPVFTAVVWFAMLVMVGGVFEVEPFTVSRKLVLAVLLPSLTVTVIVAVPVSPEAGRHA